MFVAIIISVNYFVYSKYSLSSEYDVRMTIQKTIQDINDDSEGNAMLSLVLGRAITEEKYNYPQFVSDYLLKGTPVSFSKSFIAFRDRDAENQENNIYITALSILLSSAKELKYNSVATKYFTPKDGSFIYIFSKNINIANNKGIFRNARKHQHFMIDSVSSPESNIMNEKTYYSKVYIDTLTNLKTFSAAQEVIENNTTAKKNNFIGYIFSDYTSAGLTTIFRDNGLPQEVNLNISDRSDSATTIQIHQPARWFSYHSAGIPFIGNLHIDINIPGMLIIKDNAWRFLAINLMAMLFLSLYAVIATQFHSLKKRITFDGLTGAINRDIGIDLIQKEGKENNLVIAMDVNSFKKINDTWGHAAGDRALSYVAKTIMTHIRATDYLVRNGGDEFLLIMKNISVNNADLTMRRINNYISIFRFNSEVIDLSLSYGISPLTEDVIASIHDADQAMYTYKKKHYQAREYAQAQQLPG